LALLFEVFFAALKPDIETPDHMGAAGYRLTQGARRSGASS
jgi:hypothetical protein